MLTIEKLQALAHDISAGFDTLLVQLDAQRKIEEDLRKQLARAVDRYRSTNSDNPSDGALSEWRDEIVKQISSTRPAFAQSLSEAPEIRRARDAIAALRTDITTRKCPVQHDQRPPQESAPKCPVEHVEQPTYDEMEKDFTTQGKPSSLECPFARTVNNGLDAAEDPIAAEFHADQMSAQSIDAARACGKCPIRFLDRHSPEEIAQYFEKHKHELPRSHEICVKRYQQNETSIRQLDAKYGNVVSMIQGLGNKHKQYLPSEDRPLSDSEQRSNAAVEKWAKAVDEDANVGQIELEGERRSRFEKPLRDVRVGESPSRPWGIHVPADRPKAQSAVQSIKLEPNPSLTNLVKENEGSPQVSDSACSSKPSRRTNQIIFNGPVILGYSPEQAAKFLSQIGAG